jgi:UDPglucose--hexose-1-phosphate uridylyltransferase
MGEKVYKKTYTKSDGRNWIQYSRSPFDESFKVIDEGHVRPSTWQAPTYRFNKMRNEYVAISSSRNDRPFLPPKEFCPLCPMDSFDKDENGNIVKTDTPITNQVFEWAVFENMFPGVASPNKTGHAEVVLYSPEHSGALSRCSVEHIEGLIQVWQDRSQEIGKMDHVKHVFIFENKGEEVGVTLHHPHGQIYAFDHLPPFIKAEWDSSLNYYGEHGRCLVCDIAKEETDIQKRVVTESENIVAYVPEAARYPYEVHITTKTHRPKIEDLSPGEVDELAGVLKSVMEKYNKVLDIEFPYLMVHHQAPHREPSDHYHWHLEFYPPYRAKGKLKFLAGVESGTGLFINDTIPEEKAAELRSL